MKLVGDINTETYDVEGSGGFRVDIDETEDDFEYKGLLHPETVQENKDGEGTGKIPKTEAKEIALRDAGLSENDVTITKCRIDFDDGVEKYEVEFRTADGYEYEYEIDVETGKILDKDVELDD